MKKLLLGVVLCLFSLGSIASNDLDLRGLNDVQKAELAVQVAKLKASPEAAPVAVAANVTKANDVAVDVTKKWAGVGKELASGLVGAAKELGVAVNEFAVTPVGQLTTYIIVWKLLGKDVIGLGLGVVIFFLLIPGLWYLLRRAAVFKIEYEDRKGLFGWPYRVKKSVQYDNCEARSWAYIWTILTTVVLTFLGIHFLPF